MLPLLFFSLLLAPVLAGRKAVNVVYLDAAEDSSYAWTVSNWAATANEDDAAVSSYAFNVSGPYSAGQHPIPAFVAYCAGSGVGSPYTRCHITDIRNTTHRRQVAAKLLPPTSANASVPVVNLAVSYQFDDLYTEGTWWNYTSFSDQPYTAAVSNTTFEMKPSQVFGVA